ncbi:hypothetical protein [Sulfobacillus harzensis]|uniref:PIN domain-containing protein n=1 Tax=Sulfobacillus harzensis TaxID=2729629 RepID=A0A7Y0L5L9_9FIRM|nr:hypothetical protein [Sulfobacillus harzensis]NMP23738.1 hypothetical protein [Sulfobacillus harzensis]
MKPMVTIDTNCLIAVEEKRAEADAISQLMESHREGQILLQIVAIAASENQPSGTSNPRFSEFQNRLKRIDMDGIRVLKPIAHWGVTYWDWALWSDAKMLKLEQDIHNILFPAQPFGQEEFIARERERVGETVGAPRIESKWRNHLCDVLTIWGHIWYGGNFFVTSDGNFHKVTKKAQLVALGAGQIVRPLEMAAMIWPNQDLC